MSSNHSTRPSGSGRRCSKSGCSGVASKTLTYIYSDSTAVLGPLSTFAEPHAYDFCDSHSEKLTVPKGWTVIRHERDGIRQEPTPEDLLAIAEAVREAVKSDPKPKIAHPEVGRRGHLRVLPGQK